MKKVKKVIFNFTQKFVSFLAKHKFIENHLSVLARQYLYEIRGFSYEFQLNGELELINKVADKWSELIFFDVGANVGDYSIEMLKANDKTVLHLFELNSDLHDGLKQRFQNVNAVINNFGLSNKKELVTYSKFPEMSSVNSIFPISFSHLSREHGSGHVDLGDDYCIRAEISRVNFMKIDVEGWERYVLLGFQKMLESKQIDALTWEYGYSSADSNWVTRDFYAFLSNYGYECGVVRKKGIDFSPFNYELNDFTSGPNYFACLPEHKNYFELN